MSRKPTKATPRKPALKTAIMYGLDKDNKPHAARFTGENEALLAKAAAVMGLRLAVPVTKKHMEITSKLPAGKIHATGNGEKMWTDTEMRKLTDNFAEKIKDGKIKEADLQ